MLLALWVQGVGTGSGPLQQALAAVQGDDEPHAVEAPDEAGIDGTALADLLGAWASGPRDVAAVLPAPGDLAGVPAAVSRDARWTPASASWSASRPAASRPSPRSRSSAARWSPGTSCAGT